MLFELTINESLLFSAFLMNIRLMQIHVRTSDFALLVKNPLCILFPDHLVVRQFKRHKLSIILNYDNVF